MMKKVLLITAALILAISCSGSPTDPNDTGDGGLIMKVLELQTQIKYQPS